MAQGSGLTRGDRNRNRRVEALRGAVRPDRAVLAVDLGEDKQVAVVMDHEGPVLARKVVTARAHQLAGLLEWGADRTAKAGFAGLTVACEPTGHRWKALIGLSGDAGHGFVCVQSLAVARAREGDDYTLVKTDHRDSYLIGKLVIRLECYLPERADETWGRLRHLGARRFAQVADVTSCMRQPALRQPARPSRHARSNPADHWSLPVTLSPPLASATPTSNAAIFTPAGLTTFLLRWFPRERLPGRFSGISDPASMPMKLRPEPGAA